MYEYAATVVRVIDGDTVDLVIDLGLHVQTATRVRLLGLNAAEHGTPEGDAATAWLRDKLPVGYLLMVRTKKDKTEKYGRWLGTLIRSGETTSLNTQLIEAGHAKTWDGEGLRPV